jgi:hypothetical protein
MTLIETEERVPAPEQVAVRCVDSDVHPVPRRGVLVEYIPEPWRSKYFLNHKVGEQIYYDAPDYAHAYAMRVDTFLLFSSDYPHWTFDDPRWLIKHLPEAARERVMFRNGIQTYQLPETVPALEGQVRVF